MNIVPSKVSIDWLTDIFTFTSLQIRNTIFSTDQYWKKKENQPTNNRKTSPQISFDSPLQSKIQHVAKKKNIRAPQLQKKVAWKILVKSNENYFCICKNGIPKINLAREIAAWRHDLAVKLRTNINKRRRGGETECRFGKLNAIKPQT